MCVSVWEKFAFEDAKLMLYRHPALLATNTTSICACLKPKREYTRAAYEMQKIKMKSWLGCGMQGIPLNEVLRFRTQVTTAPHTQVVAAAHPETQTGLKV